MNSSPHSGVRNLPLYPQSRPLDLADKPYFDQVFGRLQPRVSEFTFANLYLFRRAHEYSLSLVDGCVVVLGKGYRGDPYFLPPLGDDPQQALERLLRGGMTLYGADEDYAREHLVRPDLELLEDRDNFDYLYLRSSLAELPGNRYHKKKNRVNYFTARHDFELEPFGHEHVAGCLAVLEEWLRVRSSVEAGGSVALEAEAAAEAIRIADHLSLQGVVVLVDGKVKGFALGELLNSDTSVCHFEKADPFAEGLYQLVDREFCRLLYTHCTYINREQDLGEPNLRETKLSYHPVELVKKYRARVKQ